MSLAEGTPGTVAAALQLARELGVARLDAQRLVAHHLGRDRAWVLAHDEAALEVAVASRLGANLAQRAAGVPLAYLTGEREFRGLMLAVTPDVLVPRPETETLVDWAIELLDAHRLRWPQPAVADLGTGSGAVALALKAAWPSARVTATDCCEAALNIARHNAAKLGLAVDFAAGSWFAALADRRFELLLSNPPYIAGDDVHLAALRHEPRAALTPEGDGLAALRTLAAGAGGHLARGGWLLLEHGHDQATAVAQLLQEAGFEHIETRHDLAGHPRHTGGRCPE